eukprot:TRINITY_DN5040_c0_g1_i2.p1 TRINITY_DN5040_c0_g1~~TRINITY_DN5040_c0_g1_i2.p1  ORF type:complete len:1292 (+),score=331.44 TRINITY_DN5040_c0_g1_i2:45-3920(+)
MCEAAGAVCKVTGLSLLDSFPGMPEFRDAQALFMRIVEKTSSKHKMQKRMFLLRADFIALSEIPTPSVKRYFRLCDIQRVIWQNSPTGVSVLFKLRDFDTLIHQTYDKRNPPGIADSALIDTLQIVLDANGLEVPVEELLAGASITAQAMLDKKRSQGYNSPHLLARKASVERMRSMSQSAGEQARPGRAMSWFGRGSPSSLTLEPDERIARDLEAALPMGADAVAARLSAVQTQGHWSGVLSKFSELFPHVSGGDFRSAAQRQLGAAGVARCKDVLSRAGLVWSPHEGLPEWAVGVAAGQADARALLNGSCADVSIMDPSEASFSPLLSPGTAPRRGSALSSSVAVVPDGLSVISPPPALRVFDDPSLLYVRVVERHAARAGKPPLKRVVVVTPGRLVLCDPAGKITRFVRVSHIAEVVEQEVPAQKGLFGAKDGTMRVLLRLPEDPPDILLTLVRDPRNPEPDDLGRLSFVLRTLREARGLELPVQRADPHKDVVKECGATLAKPPGYRKAKERLRGGSSDDSPPSSPCSSARSARMLPPLPPTAPPSEEPPAAVLARAVAQRDAALVHRTVGVLTSTPQWVETQAAFKHETGRELKPSLEAALGKADLSMVKTSLRLSKVDWAAPAVCSTPAVGPLSAGRLMPEARRDFDLVSEAATCVTAQPQRPTIRRESVPPERLYDRVSESATVLPQQRTDDTQAIASEAALPQQRDDDIASEGRDAALPQQRTDDTQAMLPQQRTDDTQAIASEGRELPQQRTDNTQAMVPEAAAGSDAAGCAQDPDCAAPEHVGVAVSSGVIGTKAHSADTGAAQHSTAPAAADPPPQEATQQRAQPVADVAQPIGQPIGQPVGQPVAHGESQPAAQPAAQPVGQPATVGGQPVGQPVVQASAAAGAPHSEPAAANVRPAPVSDEPPAAAPIFAAAAAKQVPLGTVRTTPVLAGTAPPPHAEMHRAAAAPTPVEVTASVRHTPGTAELTEPPPSAESTAPRQPYEQAGTGPPRQPYEQAGTGPPAGAGPGDATAATQPAPARQPAPVAGERTDVARGDGAVGVANSATAGVCTGGGVVGESDDVGAARSAAFGAEAASGPPLRTDPPAGSASFGVRPLSQSDADTLSASTNQLDAPRSPGGRRSWFKRRTDPPSTPGSGSGTPRGSPREAEDVGTAHRLGAALASVSLQLSESEKARRALEETLAACRSSGSMPAVEAGPGDGLLLRDELASAKAEILQLQARLAAAESAAAEKAAAVQRLSESNFLLSLEKQLLAEVVDSVKGQLRAEKACRKALSAARAQ